jgi:hypothetical protein
VATGNVASWNALGGLSVNKATAIGNTAIENGDYGIDATCPGVLVNNTAAGNTGMNIRTNGVCTMAVNAQ